MDRKTQKAILKIMYAVESLKVFKMYYVIGVPVSSLHRVYRRLNIVTETEWSSATIQA